jgi:hypothetical protein
VSTAWLAALALFVQDTPAKACPLCQRVPAGVPTIPESEWREREALLRAEYESELLRVRDELARERKRRLEREQEWLEYTRALSLLELSEDPVSVELPPADAVRKISESIDRSEEIGRSLRALFVLEDVVGLDLLEHGRLGDGFVGPVVLRTLDPAGRPLGSISADRLRLEASRSGRTLTIVLEHGYERRNGGIVPFAVPEELRAVGPHPVLPEVGSVDDAGALAPLAIDPAQLRRGERRIVLPHVDPTPWVEALSELFSDDAELVAVPDDGRFDARLVRLALNRLLAADGEIGAFHVRALGGIAEGVLRNVQVVEPDDEKRAVRRLFADRMSVHEKSSGVLLLLESGVQMKDGRKAPFLDGRYRIFLPRVRPQDWRAAGVPVFAPGSEVATPARGTALAAGARR